MKVTLRTNRNDEAVDYIKKIATRASMQVGWFEDESYDTGVSVAGVAIKQEFGEKKIPARPFMRPARDYNSNKWRATFQGAVKKTGDVAESFETLGLVVTGDIRAAIQAVQDPPLSDTTIKARLAKYKSGGKKANHTTLVKPLIDTGLMISSVTHKVEVD